MKHKLNLVLVLVAVLVLIAVITVPWLRPEPVKVDTARAERGALTVTVNGEGKTRVKDRFTVTAPVTGLLKRIELRRGDRVVAGGIMAIIEPAPWTGQTLPNQTQPGLMQSAIVNSPVSGQVLRVMEESERVVTAGTPLIELSNTSKLEVVVDVLSTDAVKVKTGARVLVDDWGGGKTIEARVRLVEPSAFTKVSALGIEEQRVNVIAEFVGSAGLLGDGYRVEAHIVTWENADVLKIPTSALFRHGQNWGVFVVENGEACLREIETGQRTASEVEIIRGLEEGTVVITHPSNQLSNGAPVEPQINSQ